MADAALRSGRTPDDITLVAVTKTVGLPEINALYALGVRDFGENRIESASPKVAEAPQDICWHFIAPIQSRKVRPVVAMFSVVEAVDRVDIAEALQRRCEEQGRTLEIMLEANVSGEASKHGFTPDTVMTAIARVRSLDRLKLSGLMTMAPFGAPEPILRDCFRGLKALAVSADLPKCSMGMSDDFEIAIEEGATHIRVGSALFV